MRCSFSVLLHLDPLNPRSLWYSVGIKEYIFQVFCHEDSTNQWRFVFAFVESKYLDVSYNQQIIVLLLYFPLTGSEAILHS